MNVLTQSDHDGPLVVSDGQVVRVLGTRHTPHPLQSVVEGRLQSIRVGVPQSQSAIFGPGDDDGQVWVELHCRDVVRVPVQRLNTRLVLTTHKQYSVDGTVVGCRAER